MQIRRTKAYIDWIDRLKDVVARARIALRVDRLEEGNPGDSRSLGSGIVGSGIVEMKINFGPGYRVYYTQRGDTLILLLCGGDKSMQSKDIARAKLLLAQYEEE
jgi:putative addiction module killer protein